MAESSDRLLSPELMRQLDRLDVRSRKLFPGTMIGERRSKRRGQSVEFADYRPYVAGDDLRFIDWNLYARLERLFLRLFLEEVDLCVAVAVDVTRSMTFGDPSKLLFAQRAAAALAYVGLVRQNRVSLFAMADGVAEQVSGLRGRRPIPRMLSFLDELAVRDQGNFDAACRQLAQRNPHKGVVVVISDFLDKGDLANALRWLAGRNHDVFALQVLSPQELEPSEVGLIGDLRLRDVEDRSVVDVSIDAPVMKAYRRNLEQFRESVRDACLKRGVQHLFVDSRTRVDHLVLRLLRERGLVG